MGHVDSEQYHACCDEGDGAAGHCACERHRRTPYQQLSCHFRGARHGVDPDLVVEREQHQNEAVQSTLELHLGHRGWEAYVNSAVLGSDPPIGAGLE